jgi:hypothetical protein
MARKPDTPSKPPREWRISIIRDRSHYLGRVVAADAIDSAMEEYRHRTGAAVPADRRAGRVMVRRR